MPEGSRRCRRSFVAILVEFNLALLAGLAWVAWQRLQPSGAALNRIAWQATFTERSL